MAKRTTIILGIDPGTNFTGYGVISVCGNTPTCLGLGHINLSKHKDTYVKLKHIFEQVGILIDRYSPQEVALESPFFGENVQSMLKLGRAQGVAMAAALTRNIDVFEYAPRRIKQSITGNGGASKEQVAMLLKSLLKVDYEIGKLDATDGLAVALCHHFERQSHIHTSGIEKTAGLSGKQKSAGKGSLSWESFLIQNPDREVKKK